MLALAALFINAPFTAALFTAAFLRAATVRERASAADLPNRDRKGAGQ